MPPMPIPAQERRTDEELHELARHYAQSRTLAERCEAEADKAKAEILQELDAREAMIWEHDDGTRVTKVQPAPKVEYDADGLARDLVGVLTGAEATDLFREVVDLNALPEDVKAALLGLVDAAHLAAATRRSVNRAALEDLSRRRRIPVAVLRRHTTTKQTAASIRVKLPAEPPRAST